jgi:hypothetical protein
LSITGVTGAAEDEEVAVAGAASVKKIVKSLTTGCYTRALKKSSLSHTQQYEEHSY